MQIYNYHGKFQTTKTQPSYQLKIGNTFNLLKTSNSIFIVTKQIDMSHKVFQLYKKYEKPIYMYIHDYY